MLKKSDEFRTLEELCRPVQEYLREHKNPHTAVVIKDNNCEVVTTEIFVPLKSD